jgi:hypothetical protein
MAKQKSPILVGVFENFAQAQQAYNELRNARFGDDYIGLADPRRDDDHISKQLTDTDVPEEDSQFYEREFNAGHPLVTLRVGGLQQDAIQKAIDILRRNGAYDANSRRKSPNDFGSNVKTDARTPLFDIAPGTQESQS